MAKRKLSKQPNVRSQGVVREEIGSGITKRRRTRFVDPLNDEGLALLKDVLARVANPLTEMEAILREFLREAGFPDDPTEGGKYPFRSHVTPELNESEYQSGTWYAAAILDELAARKRSFEIGDTRGAAEAEGQARYLYRERFIKAEYEPDILAHDRIRAGAVKGGRKPKSIPAVRSFIRDRLRKNPSLTARALWNLIPEEEFEAVRIGKKVKLFIELWTSPGSVDTHQAGVRAACSKSCGLT